jgi:hypothetical protein
MINKTITHIMGETGSGKTYFATQQAIELVKNNQKVLFLSRFDDINDTGFEKIYITSDQDVENVFTNDPLAKQALHVVFPPKDIGSEESTRLENEFLHRICQNLENTRSTYLFIDEAQNIDEINLTALLSEARKYDIKIILIHQYFDQLTEKVQSDLDYFLGTGIYFKTSGNEIVRILEKFPDSGKIVDDIENLKLGEYIVFEK